MLQLKNIFDLTFKREFELTHGSLDAPNIPGKYYLKNLDEELRNKLSLLKGPTASELLLYMRSSGWLSLSTDLQVTGLPRWCLVESCFAEFIINC